MTRLILALILVSNFYSGIVLAQRSNRLVPVQQYNSCATNPEEAPIPDFIKDINNLTRSEKKNYRDGMLLDEFELSRCIAVPGDKKDNVGDACMSAWASARFKYLQIVQKFVNESYEPGTYKITTGTPLTVLKQIPVYDTCPESRGYTCYMLAYIRKDAGEHIFVERIN